MIAFFKSRTPLQALQLTLFITLLVKVAIALLFPIMASEEAYFTSWAENPALGYYDHPPMVGWWIGFMLLFGKNELLVRIPALLTTVVISLGIYRLTKEIDNEKASWAAILYLVSPAYLLNGFISHSTPLDFFTFFGGYFFYKAYKAKGTKAENKLWILVGVCLGLGFLSKYLIVMVAFAMVLSLIYFRRKAAFKPIVIMTLMAVAISMINVYWNATNCWYTFNFHLFNRHPTAGFDGMKIVMYLVTLLYILTPWAVFYAIKNRKELKTDLTVKDYWPVFVVFLLPLLFFLSVSFKVKVGLHWLTGYTGLGFLGFFFFLKKEQLKKSVIFSALFSGLQVIALMILLLIPVETFKSWEYYHLAVFNKHPEPFIEKLKEYEKDYIITSYDYTVAAELRFHSDRYIPVFAYGGYHSRQDDIHTDFSKFDGKDILIIVEYEEDMMKYIDFFESYEHVTYQVKGATYNLMLGKKFNFPRYRIDYLQKVANRSYNVPSFFPMMQCDFLERYDLKPNITASSLKPEPIFNGNPELDNISRD